MPRTAGGYAQFRAEGGDPETDQVEDHQKDAPKTSVQCRGQEADRRTQGRPGAAAEGEHGDAEDRDDEGSNVEPQARRDLGREAARCLPEKNVLRARATSRGADCDDDDGRDEQGGGNRDEDGAPGLGAAHGLAAEPTSETGSASSSGSG